MCPNGCRSVPKWVAYRGGGQPDFPAREPFAAREPPLQDVELNPQRLVEREPADELRTGSTRPRRIAFPDAIGRFSDVHRRSKYTGRPAGARERADYSRCTRGGHGASVADTLAIAKSRERRAVCFSSFSQ